MHEGMPSDAEQPAKQEIDPTPEVQIVPEQTPKVERMPPADMHDIDVDGFLEQQEKEDDLKRDGGKPRFYL